MSFTFGPDVVSRFLQKHDMDLICRAHQVVEDGYEFFSKRQLVTLFSAPNYCGEFDNAGAMMSVDESLLCSFQVSLAALGVFLLTLLDPQAGREKEGSVAVPPSTRHVLAHRAVYAPALHVCLELGRTFGD